MPNPTPSPKPKAAGGEVQQGGDTTGSPAPNLTPNPNTTTTEPDAQPNPTPATPSLLSAVGVIASNLPKSSPKLRARLVGGGFEVSTMFHIPHHRQTCTHRRFYSYETRTPKPGKANFHFQFQSQLLQS